jgi:hypothetical protein
MQAIAASVLASARSDRCAVKGANVAQTRWFQDALFPQERQRYQRPIRPVLLAGSCPRRTESGPDDGATTRKR